MVWVDRLDEPIVAGAHGWKLYRPKPEFLG